MSEQFNIIERITIDLPAAKVWDSTANDFGNIAEWNASLSGVKFDDNQADGAGQERVCISPFGDTSETMVTYDEESLVFGYQIEGLPPFITRAVNNWSVRAVSDNSSELEWNVDITTGDGAEPEMVNGFKGQLGQLIAEGQEELKYWLETGEPHPRKLAAMQQS